MNNQNQHEQIDLARQRTTLALERNLMAAQRTFTSWIRTGLAGVGGGILIMKVLSFSRVEHKLIATMAGQLMILWGILIFIFAFTGYSRISSKLLLEHGELRPAFWGICIISITLIVVSFTLLIITSL